MIPNHSNGTGRYHDSVSYDISEGLRNVGCARVSPDLKRRQRIA
jgi:hypothetical protein